MPTYDGIVHDEGGGVFNVKNPAYWTPLSGEDTANDALKIMRAVTAASTAGGGTVFLPQGTYNIKSTVLVPSNVTFAGAGAGTILKRDSSFGGDGLPGRYLLRVQGTITKTGSVETVTPAVNVTIRDLALDGNRGSVLTLDQDWASSSLLVVSIAQWCTVENIWAYEGTYDGIILEYCKDCVVRGCKITRQTKGALYLSGSNRIMVSNNVTWDSTYSSLLGASWFCTVTGNVFRRSESLPVGSSQPHAGLSVGRDSEYCTITGNYCQGFDTDLEPVLSSGLAAGVGLPEWIAAERPAHPAYDSTALGNGHPYAMYNCVVANNVVTGHAMGIRLLCSNRNRVIGNDVQCNASHGVLLYGSSRNVVAANTIADNGAPESVTWSVKATALEVANFYNSTQGTTPIPSIENVVEDNEIRDDRASPVANGIYIDTGCVNTVVRNNRITTPFPISTPTGGVSGTAKYGNYIVTSSGATVDGGITP